jgi:hypothetical protein
MNKSIEDLERITRDKASIEDLHLSETLAPLTLNVEKVFYIIQRFNMLPSKAE